MSNKCVVKAEMYHIVDDMYHSFMPLLQKRPDKVILHGETNEVSPYDSPGIVICILQILKRRSFISQKFPNTKFCFI